MVCKLSCEKSTRREGTREFHSLLASAHLSLGLLPCHTLLPGLPGHARRAGARSDGKPFACEPRFGDAPYDVEGARLHYPATDELAAPYTNVDDALESERESVGGMFVERFWDQGRDGFGWMVVGRQKAVKERRVSGGGGEMQKSCSMRTRRSRPPSITMISRIRGEVEVR
jgi:hypothetical protein